MGAGQMGGGLPPQLRALLGSAQPQQSYNPRQQTILFPGTIPMVRSVTPLPMRLSAGAPTAQNPALSDPRLWGRAV